MLKPRLIKVVEEVFAIGGNHNAAKDMELREKLLDFLREEDHLILPNDDENLMLVLMQIGSMQEQRVVNKHIHMSSHF